MLEKNTDRLFWTLTSIIVGALLLTISVKAFPSVAETAISPITGIVKQADTVGHKSDDTANKAFSDINPPTNNYGQTDAQAKAAAPNIQLFSNVDPSTGITWNIQPDGYGGGVLAGITLPQGYNQSTVNIPEYINAHDFSQGNPMLVHVTSLNSGSSFGLLGDWSKVTTLNVPSSVKSIPSGFFDMSDNRTTGGLVQNLTVNIPKNGNYNPSTQQPAISTGSAYNTYNGITITANNY